MRAQPRVNPRSRFSQRALELRQHAGLTVRAWAQELDVSPNTIVRWEHDYLPDHPDAVLLLMEQVAGRRAERGKG